jgi:hypothetical protein
LVAPINVSALHYRSDVTVRHTLDGTDPTSSSPIYTAPITVNASGTFKARAFLAGAPPSQLSSAVYNLLVATPTISPPGTTFSSSVLVTLTTTTSDAQIHYTLDGTDPTTSSTLYSTPLSLDFSAMVKARAFHAGLTASNVATAQFTRTGTSAATPTISPPGGHLTGNTMVTIASTTPGAELHYTVDGRDVFRTAPLYTGPFTVNGSVVVKGRAYAAGFAPSAQANAAFHLRSVWSSTALPMGTPARDRHTALGSDWCVPLFHRRQFGKCRFFSFAERWNCLGIARTTADFFDLSRAGAASVISAFSAARSTPTRDTATRARVGRSIATMWLRTHGFAATQAQPTV